MSSWKSELNRLAVEFWYEIADIEEAVAWVDSIYKIEGEVHPLMWDFLSPQSYPRIKYLAEKISGDINGFEVGSRESLPYAQAALLKAIIMLRNQELSVQKFCNMVSLLDCDYNLFFPLESERIDEESDWHGWLGNLWNCCDWCDESWNHSNSSHLLEEAYLVAKKLAKRINDDEMYATFPDFRKL